MAPTDRARLRIATLLVGAVIPALVVAGSPVAAAPAPGPVENPTGAGKPGGGGGDDRGQWSVTATGPDTWTVAWRAPEPLPMTSDRPTIVAAGSGALSAGAPLGVPTVAKDGRTVEVTVVSAEEPDPAELDVVLSGERLDEPPPGNASKPAPTPRWQGPVRELLGVDPGTRGELSVTTSSYRLDDISLPGIANPVEMVGHVVEPSSEDADPSHPLVLLVHGRHPTCYVPGAVEASYTWPCTGDELALPNHLGYDYLQRLLASRGFVTVSISTNSINAQDANLSDGGTDARAKLVRAHLDQWAQWAGDEHEVDLSRVVLVGHSRGGEGVARAALEIPLGAPYTVAGQVLIAPTSFGGLTTPYVPTVTMLPSCDGDVIELNGQFYTDRARRLVDGDTSMKSSVMVVGANHNYFNTEWTPGLSAAPSADDWGGKGGVCGPRTETRLSAAEQRRVGKAYVAGAVHLFAAGDQRYRPMYDGSPVRVGSTGDAVVLSHMLGGDRTLRVPGVDAALTAPVGATTVLCEGTTPVQAGRRPLCGRYAGTTFSTPHWPALHSLVPTSRAFEMSWRAAGARGGLEFDDPLDAGGADWLDLRTVVDPQVGDVDLRVRVTDAAGRSVTVRPEGGGALHALPTGDRWIPGKYWAQTLRLDTSSLTSLDRSSLSAIELVGRSAAGRLWVLDVAAASAALPAVPAKRVPIVDLGEVTVDEGGDGTHVAEVPFTVTGPVVDPAKLRVYAFGGDRAKPIQVDVDLAPGSSGGTIEWEYTGDTLDSYRKSTYELFGAAIRNVMTRDNNGAVVVLDDDPTPEVSIRALERRVPEGSPVRLELSLSSPSGKEMGVRYEVVAGYAETRPLRAHDVGARWLETWTRWKEGTDPALHRTRAGQRGSIPPGRTVKVFRIPVVDDGRSEPRESLTVVATGRGGWRSDPVTVHVPGHP